MNDATCVCLVQRASNLTNQIYNFGRRQATAALQVLLEVEEHRLGSVGVARAQQGPMRRRKIGHRDAPPARAHRARRGIIAREEAQSSRPSENSQPPFVVDQFCSSAVSASGTFVASGCPAWPKRLMPWQPSHMRTSPGCTVIQ